MSDGEDDYGGDYDDTASVGFPEDDAVSEAEPREEALGLDEDAAGSDEEEETDGEAAEEEDIKVVDDRHSAMPQRLRADPILRISNKPRVVRIVHPEDRVTDTRLQLAEAARVLATRAQQIARYATCFTNTEGLHDPVDKARKELYDRCCPLCVRRFVGVNEAGETLVEEFKVREMVLPPLASLLEQGE